MILKINISLSTVSPLVKIQRAGYFNFLRNFGPLMIFIHLSEDVLLLNIESEIYGQGPRAVSGAHSENSP